MSVKALMSDYSEEYIVAQKAIDQLEKKYRAALVVNSDLDRKLVSFQANKSEPIFRWFHYREGFSKQLIEYVLDELQIPAKGRMLDPFAGTGAASFVGAQYRAMSSIAVELMPVGVFFMESRNLFASLSNSQIVEFARSALKSRSEWLKVTSKWSFNHLNITHDAFSEDSQNELEQFKTWASRRGDKSYAKFLDFVAFSILERFSYTRKDGQYLRWDHRSPRFEKSGKKTTFDKGVVLTFHQALEEKLKAIIDDLEIQTDLFEDIPEATATVDIIQGSILEEIDQIKNRSINCVITSPPYCNRYDYTRTYALELAYLGVDEDAIRKLRQTLLTCTVENKPKQFEWLPKAIKKDVDAVFLEQDCLQKIICFLQSEADAGLLNNKGIKTMVEGYFYDSAVHLRQISQKMKKGGYYVMVNDNVRYNGLEVPVDLILSELAVGFGFEVEKIWVLPKGKGNSSQQMKKHGRAELRKCVYVWKKL